MLQHVAPRGLRRDQYSGRLSERPAEYRTHVNALLPRHLVWANPIRQVVDEDRRGRRVVLPEWRARPERIEDRVALELRLNRGQPARLQGDLVTVGRKYSLALQGFEGSGAFAAAEQGEIVLTSTRDQGLGQLHRHREHADPTRPPAGGDINGKPGHPA